MTTIKEPEFFKNFKTIVQHGIEIMTVGGRPYRVYRTGNAQLWLLPITSAFDEAAKEKYRNHQTQMQ